MQKIIRHLLSFGFMCALCFAPLSSVTAASTLPYIVDDGLSIINCTRQDSYTDAFNTVNDITANDVRNCTTTKKAYFKNLSGTYFAVQYCDCVTGQTQVDGLINIPINYNCGGSNLQIKYAKSCSTSSSSGGIGGSGNVTIACQVPGCSSDTDWVTVPSNPGYKRKVTRVCVATRCNVLNTVYQCADGYYQSGDITCSTSNFILRCSGCTKPCTEGEVKTETDNSEPGYIKTTTYTCNTKTGEYNVNEPTCQCAKGYYGNADYQNDACLGCTRCPLDETIGQYGTTDDVGKTKDSDCYLPAGTYTDTKGTFTVSDKKDGAVCNQTAN